MIFIVREFYVLDFIVIVGSCDCEARIERVSRLLCVDLCLGVRVIELVERCDSRARRFFVCIINLIGVCLWYFVRILSIFDLFIVDICWQLKFMFILFFV